MRELRWRRARRLTAVAVTCALLLIGCSRKDPLQVGDPTPATPASAPPIARSPEGLTWQVGAEAEGIAVDHDAGLLAVAVQKPTRLALVKLSSGEVVRTVPLRAPARHVIALPGGGFRVAAGSELVTVPRIGEPVRVSLPNRGLDLAVLPDGKTVVTLPDEEKAVIIDPNTGKVGHTLHIGGFPDGITVVGDQIGVIDTIATSLTVYRSSDGERLQSLRSGNGATHVITDKRNRLVAIDTRDGEILVFGTDPLNLRQRGPAPGHPYGMAYDANRDVLWLTFSDRNEVAGYDLSGGAPKEIIRYSTVRQPDAVAVDPVTGAVYVAGKADGIVQAIGEQPR